MNEILQRIYSPGLILGGQRLHIIRQYTVHPIFLSNIRRGLQSLTWSPTIALSWLWGLGFFYSFHVTIEEGWIGFLCFALPNAVGLFVFGFVLGSERLDPAKMLSMVQVKYCSLFLLTQVLAVSITIFGFVVYLWQPLFLSSALAPIGVIILVGCAMGHLSSASTLKRLHVLYLCIGVSAALFALAALHTSPVQPSLGSLSSRFSGLLLPIVIGLLLGPWMDVQQWQRAVEIRRHGGSISSSIRRCSGLVFCNAHTQCIACGWLRPGWPDFLSGRDRKQSASRRVDNCQSRFGCHRSIRGLGSNCRDIDNRQLVCSYEVDDEGNYFEQQFTAVRIYFPKAGLFPDLGGNCSHFSRQRRSPSKSLDDVLDGAFWNPHDRGRGEPCRGFA